MSLCAPTSNSHAYYRMTVRGLGVTTTTGQPGGVTASFGGTSSATPLVAGVAGLAISANPDLSALDLISILKQTASRDLDFSGYQSTAPASFDPDTSWDVSPVAPFDNGEFSDSGDADGSWSPWFGYGRVDAAAAVAEAMSRRQQTGNEVFESSSSPDRSIPDNSTRGIRDKIHCAHQFAISAVTVDIDITHTYVGDLRITLTSPVGTAVLLHDRAGGSANDLHGRFDIRSSPALHALTGQPVNGDWTLHVQDLAAVDRGRLIKWGLSISGQTDRSIQVEESPGVIIPDNDQGGIERSLAVAGAGQLDGIVVDLDITHTYIGDLMIELVSPDNRPVLLHGRTGGSADNIIKTYTMTNTGSLQGLRGGAVAGTWRLKVSDHAGLDQGKLNRWALTIKPAP
jgi:subtilisin-like proprotein convertase family protein